MSIIIRIIITTFILNNEKLYILINTPVAVFDSGIGSLSIIQELKKEIPHENLLYFADKAHFPYGNKSATQLRDIIVNTVNYLERYKPKLTVIASNTPSIAILDQIRRMVNVPLIGIRPPLKEACRLTKKKHIGIMATKLTISSKELENQIKREVPQKILVTKFNASPIIELIEKGIHISNERKTFDTINQVIGYEVDKEIDVITLSSTHLPFVKSYLNSLLPTIKFVDSAKTVAKEVRKYLIFNRMLKKTGNGRLQIFVSDQKRQFEQIIHAMGIREPVEEIFLTF
ncbi:MAG TPA: glutamate racemase [Nitrososphaeraceae archaeon]|jgi:glutamate racemase|nr:glutamate racemase [Nitrososphaeraceae archaeon]